MKRPLSCALTLAVAITVSGCGAAAPQVTPTPVSRSAAATTQAPTAPTSAPSRFPVPIVKGKTATGARWRLEQAGLKVKVTWTRNPAARGKVVAQKPSSGKVKAGSTVAIAVSSGPKGYSGTAQSASGSSTGATSASDETLARLFEQHKNGVQVSGRGVVDRVLADDTEGGRHQRFILRLGSGQTLLIAHNIDIAPRLPSLSAGDSVEFKGIYEWNSQGGVVHWTHHDPSGQHPTGWLKYNGATYK
jgi:hypothetical protein